MIMESSLAFLWFSIVYRLVWLFICSIYRWITSISIEYLQSLLFFYLVLHANLDIFLKVQIYFEILFWDFADRKFYKKLCNELAQHLYCNSRNLSTQKFVARQDIFFYDRIFFSSVEKRHISHLQRFARRNKTLQ